MEKQKSLKINADDIRYISGIVFMLLSIYLLFSRKSEFSSLVDDLAAGENMYLTVLALIYFFTYLIIGIGILRKAPIISAIGVIAIIFYVQHVMTLTMLKYNAVTIIASIGILLVSIYLTICAKEEKTEDSFDSDDILDNISDLKAAYENHEISEDEFLETRNKIIKMLTRDVQINIKQSPSFD